MELDSPRKQMPLKSPIRKTIENVTPKRTKPPVSAQPTSGIESPVLVTTVPTSLSTTEAAFELHKLRTRISSTPDEKWRTLDARDRILRAWGGAGSRVKVGGATIGTCPDMCPEKELLHRQAEHQVMTLETIMDSDGLLEEWRAVKQYSRSSADQEIPMCYELRPAPVLMRTCAYLLHEIADTSRQVTLADWFHFMWDRFRGIRKDITQQALCCAESIRMVEICARFHAHCAARLADLEHTQFDQKLNTDNLTKCLQTLKHMYADVRPDQKPNEAEFRGYIALLNLGDANFWWEIKQLPLEIQKSESITFAIQIYTVLDNNNYVRFFRLVREKATYLQACILLRYFNDVRARALARIVKAYAPRGGSLFPAEDLMNSLAFESTDSMKAFINHYGLRFAKNESELTVILNRNQFIEDSDPYPVSRAIQLIESKRNNSVGGVISGGDLPRFDYANQNLYTSFSSDSRIKQTALLAEDIGYNTLNDSNKDVKALKLELQKLSQSGVTKSLNNIERPLEQKKPVTFKPDYTSKKDTNVFSKPLTEVKQNKIFSFQPAIPVAPVEIISDSPEKVQTETKSIFTFSKPQETESNVFKKGPSGNLFTNKSNNLFATESVADARKIFAKVSDASVKPNISAMTGTFKTSETDDVFKKPTVAKSIFSQPLGNKTILKSEENSRNIFLGANTSVQTTIGNNNVFSKVEGESSLFSKPKDNIEKSNNIFAKASQDINNKNPASIFGSFNKPSGSSEPKPFESKTIVPNSNGDTATIMSPGTLFKSANQPFSETTKYTIFQSKNKGTSVADNIFNSVQLPNNNVYEFDNNDESVINMERKVEYEIQEEKRRQEEVLREQEKRLELLRKEEEKRKQEEQRKWEELKKVEEKRKREEAKIQEELKKRLEEEKKAEIQRREEEKKAELKRIAEEKERLFKERVKTESAILIDELIDEIRDDTVKIILQEEIDQYKELIAFVNEFTENICQELVSEISSSELNAEIFRTKKLMKKWFYVWRKQFIRNFKRRSLLEGTPVWLPDKTFNEEAKYLKRFTEKSALQNMNAIHRGYKFTGELRNIPAPPPYNIVDLIRSPLLKRMKQIEYPYDKCFFWKVTLVSPGPHQWLCKKINVDKFLQDAFGDGKQHDISDSLINVHKQSWNNLMDFAISVSLIDKEKLCIANEALNGANSVIFYATESDDVITVIENVLNQKYLYQFIPIAVILPKRDDSFHRMVNEELAMLLRKKIITDYRVFHVDHLKIEDSINNATKSALKWLAKKYPKPPPLEIDYLKSICQRYLGNEIWYKLKSERDERTGTVLRDLQKLVNCYNVAVEKLTQVITNEDLFNYTSFPLEFNQYLDNTSPYPKPYEFITSNVKQSDNTYAIKNMMQKLKLPCPKSSFLPKDVITMQEQIRKYCNQIGWSQDSEKVVCKVVAVLPDELADITVSCDDFEEYFEKYDLIDMLNVIVYEKINSLNNFENRFATYLKSDLEKYRNVDWLYDIDDYSKTKHKALQYEDEIDFFIKAKRRKIASDSYEYLSLEEKDRTRVNESIGFANQSISNLNTCKDAVSQLELKLNEEKKKSDELENLLRTALSNV